MTVKNSSTLMYILNHDSIIPRLTSEAGWLHQPFTESVSCSFPVLTGSGANSCREEFDIPENHKACQINQREY